MTLHACVANRAQARDSQGPFIELAHGRKSHRADIGNRTGIIVGVRNGAKNCNRSATDAEDMIVCEECCEREDGGGLLLLVPHRAISAPFGVRVGKNPHTLYDARA
jgi:hypothetical protein